MSNSTNRNIVYKTSDKITAKIAPTQLFDILRTSSVSANDLSVQLVKSGLIESDVATLTTVGTNVISLRNGNFIRLVDPIIITNMKDSNEDEIFQYINSLSEDLKNSFSNSYFNIILNDQEIYNKKNATFYVDNFYLESNKMNLNVDNLIIKDNIIHLNSKNINNTHNITGFNLFVNDYRSVEPSESANNMIVFVPYLNLDPTNKFLIQINSDETRFQNNDTDITDYYHNVRFIRNNLEEFSIDFISNINRNEYKEKTYLPIEADRLIVHEGSIINCNENGNLIFKVYQETTGSVVYYKNMLELLNSTSISPNRYANFNTSMRLNRHESIEPRVYFDTELYFSNSTEITDTSETPGMNDYFLHMTGNDVNINKNLVFTNSTNNQIKGGDMEITFSNTFKIADSKGEGNITVDGSGNFTINGNLKVTGSTTTSIKSTNIEISDSIIELSSGLTGAEIGDSGIIIERGSSGDNAFIGWDRSAGKFILGTTTATGSSTGDLTIANSELQINGIDSGSDNFTFTSPNVIVDSLFTLKNGNTSAGKIEFYEESSNGNNKITLLGVDNLTTDHTLTLSTSGGTIITTNDLATDKVKGIASFDTNHFNVTDGAVSSAIATDKVKGIASFDTNHFTVTAGAVSSAIATDTVKGIASFNTDHFTVTAGAVSSAIATDKVKGIASFDTNHFNVTDGAVSSEIATDKVKGIASFDTNHFNVTDGAVSSAIATDTVKGIASFNSSYFTVTDGVVSFKTDSPVSINTEINDLTKLGIGTDAPTCLLHVSAGLPRVDRSAQNEVPENIEKILNNNTVSLLLQKTDGRVYYGIFMGSESVAGSSYIQAGSYTGVNSLLLNPNGGKLGIGTKNTLETALHLENDEPYITLKNSTSDIKADGGESRIIFKNNEGYELSRIQGSQHKDNTGKDGNLIFSTNDGTDITEALRIDGDQNIGIGTNSVKKDRKLHVSTDNSTYMRLSGFVGNDAKEKYLEFASDSEFNAIYSKEKDSNNLVSTADGDETTLKIISGDLHITNSDNNDRMVIKEDGTVGIGTNSPSSTSILTIKKDSGVTQGTSTTMIDFLLKNSSDTNGDDNTVLATIEAGHSNVSADKSYRSGFISFKTNFMEDNKGTYVDRFYERMRIEANGNIGIGTTSPDSTLHVNGETHLKGETHIDNPNIKLGGYDTKDKGIHFLYDSGAPHHGFFGYDQSEGNFIFKKEITDTDGIISGGNVGEIVADLKGTVNQVEQNSITTMNSLTSIGSSGNTTTIKGPVVFNDGFGASSNVLTTTQDITSGGTYIINNTASIDLTLGSLTTGTLITLYGGGVSDYTLTGVNAITSLNGTTITNRDKKLTISKTSTVICIATGTNSWVTYVDGTYPTPT